MANQSVRTIPYRRKREQRTDYKRRLNSLKGRAARLVIRKSNAGIFAQLVEYTDHGDKVLAHVQSSHLAKYGMEAANGNIPCAYLVGLLIAKKAKEQGVEYAVADLGLQVRMRGNKLFATIKGAVDGGLNVPLDESAAPSEDRLTGKHIAENGVTKFTQIKDPKNYPKMVAQVKEKIMQG